MGRTAKGIFRIRRETVTGLCDGRRVSIPCVCAGNLGSRRGRQGLASENDKGPVSNRVSQTGSKG